MAERFGNRHLWW